jgi:hypothetical protein
MFGTHFYHEKIKKSVAIFGRMFNNIYVIRKNSTGQVVSQVKVPLSYAPKQKYLERVREQSDLSANSQVAIKLPRMSFEITSFDYDLTRQLTKISTFNSQGTAKENRRKFFTPIPYNISFQLNIYAKSQDDALQIVEQIIPFFNPQYTLTIKPFATEFPNFKEDMPIVIQGLSFSDDYEGDLAARRTIVYTIDFQMKANFYGPINTSDIIRKSITDVSQIKVGLSDSDIQISRITVTPNPDSAIGLVDSDFGFTSVITLIGDSS